MERLLGASWISLLLHQVEEYGWPGRFPGILNRCFFRSDRPDRYPLNPRSAFWINVGVAWGSYGLAALAGEAALWLGIATLTVSLGNVGFHCVILNRRARTWYPLGVGTSVVLFLPLTALFFGTLGAGEVATAADYWMGRPLGLVLNFAGIVGLLRLLADPGTEWAFAGHQAGTDGGPGAEPE